ncbi:MAG: hypothetical protein KAR03_12650 [Candidatus Thorarchaeota archaeon]|nr:hypothetical protein [Candidatus Thorarchaeota archaeon]
MAKKAVDSTLKRILNYTAEIIMSIILLVTICIPLAFTIPMWFQHVIFDVPRPELSINPAAWFGLDGTLWITLGLALVSVFIAYLYILKLKPGVTSDSVKDETDEEVEEKDVADEETEDSAAEDLPEEVAEDVPLEDQEAEDEPDLDEIEESVEEKSEED